MFAIEKNVPLPDECKTQGRKGCSKYGFHRMEVGDSILFEGEKSTFKSKPCISAHTYGAKSNKKFRSKTVDGGVRIWRIE